MNRRVLIVIGLSVFLVLILVLSIISRPKSPPPPLTGSIIYTDAVTGLGATDIVQQTEILDPFSANRATVTIDGIDKLYNTLTSDQASSVQDTLENYLMAHSGLQSVQAGIKDDEVNAPDDNNLTFTLVTTTPQASYLVSVHINNQYQTTPDVTIRED